MQSKFKGLHKCFQSTSEPFGAYSSSSQPQHNRQNKQTHHSNHFPNLRNLKHDFWGKKRSCQSFQKEIFQAWIFRTHLRTFEGVWITFPRFPGLLIPLGNSRQCSSLQQSLQGLGVPTERPFQSTKHWNPWKTNIEPKKKVISNKKLLFQGSIFGFHVCFYLMNLARCV